MTIGERLKKARGKRGFTQKALADQSELSDAYISLLEREDTPHHIKNPGVDGLKRLAAVLEVPEEWLILGVGDEPAWPEAQAATGAEGAA